MVTQNTVGIFSRDGESCYKWLVTYLLTFIALGDVHSVYITNNNYHSVREKISLCNFAILYHTKRRGRVNITDVTDSLYDAELEMLLRSLGKEKVIVVIDDLDDSSSTVKDTILQKQPSIRRLTQDLVLFSVQDKQNHEVMTDKLNHIMRLIKRPANLREDIPINIPINQDPLYPHNCQQNWNIQCNKKTIMVGSVAIVIIIVIIILSVTLSKSE